jgi:hypothetical protein
LIVHILFISLPQDLALSEFEGEEVGIIVSRQAVVPLLQILEENINSCLKGDNDQIEQEVEDEVLNSDTIQRGHDSLVVVNPN